MAKQIREIRVKDLVCYYYLTLLTIILLTAGLVFALNLFFTFLIKTIIIVTYAVVMYFTLKYHAIGCILMYKAYAPLDVRNQCRFEPTCSTYMIMAINKYGLIRGVIKGIKRVKRCKPPNGGVDYP